jgi:hypothetical protein
MEIRDTHIHKNTIHTRKNSSIGMEVGPNKKRKVAVKNELEGKKGYHKTLIVEVSEETPTRVTRRG